MDNISIDKWGKDHWSTLLYLETRMVDFGGNIDYRHIRTDGDKDPTRLNDESEVVGHSDYDVFVDLEEADFITKKPPAIYGLTDKGWFTVGLLRRNRAEGGTDHEFRIPRL